MSRNWLRAIFVVVAYSVLTLWAIFSLIPLLWLFVSALTPQDYLMRIPPIIRVSDISLSNFTELFTRGQIIRWFINSFYIAATVTVLQLFFDALGGYVLAKKDFPGRKWIFAAILGTMMIPPQVTLVPTFLILSKAHLIDTHLSIIIPQLVGAFGIFMMRQYISSLPSELLDAARIDGASEFSTFVRIILPLTGPALAVLGIFIFVANWNSFLWPLIVLNSPSKFTLQVGLSTLQDQYVTDYGILMAGAAIAAIPMIAVFFAFGKHMTKGLTVGAIKG